eukprot:TRINITY_DN7666_c0_g1_i2.p1 TRINITY_DN7666_c0_g1~~TRINITY_DN7666_c0_g1_i2.p1  ORF type:complete len:109 (+),score=3.56 TRINITY_DN7666_c0_g1_i2:54-380(+)
MSTDRAAPAGAGQHAVAVGDGAAAVDGAQRAPAPAALGLALGRDIAVVQRLDIAAGAGDLTARIIAAVGCLGLAGTGRGKGKRARGEGRQCMVGNGHEDVFPAMACRR